MPYPTAYEKPYSKNISDRDFEQLLGYSIDRTPHKPRKGEYTLDCCIDDIKSTLAGKIAMRTVMRRAKSVGAEGSKERKSFIASAMYTPLSAVCAMSDGAMTLNTAKGLISIANGKLFKGIRLIIKK